MIPYHWQYVPLLMQIVVAFGMGTAFVAGSWLIGRHRNTKTKLAAYECGIVAVGDARGRFSVRFYMVAMLFILFDVEAVFIMP
ncbi:MAG TPA: NADH-quinone oxidoreductase subunit A, partial [Terracidiphilus sp.]|nr:NADH-quinone oxidoreductase subunit A [Terracidiphilus sp.]